MGQLNPRRVEIHYDPCLVACEGMIRLDKLRANLMNENVEPMYLSTHEGKIPDILPF